QDVVDHAENCRGRTNPQRQRNDGHNRKSGSLAQVPKRILDVLPQRFHIPPVKSTRFHLFQATSTPVMTGWSLSRPPRPCRGHARETRALPYLELRTGLPRDRKSTRLNSSHGSISYAVFCLKKKKEPQYRHT